MSHLKLSCNCGAVQGVASGITPASGNRVVCCSDDCQAFAEFLQPDAETGDVLDEFGGTDIYQTSQSQMTIHQGQEHLKSLRLRPKGLLRWYTGCCNTPVGNTVNAGMPFVGLIHTFADRTAYEMATGTVRAYIQTRYARCTPSYPVSSPKFPPGITLRLIYKMLVWKLLGKNKPSVFFANDGRPVAKPLIVSKS